MKEQFRKSEFLYIVPIRSKDTLVGAILVGEKLSEATYQHEDLSFLAAVAKQASVAIENAFLYEELAEQERMKHELAIARRIQMASLPQHTPNIDGLDIAGTSIPALEVGGDYFDYLNGEAQKLTVIVGDVSGKGTSAALYMSKVQGILRSLHGFGLSPRDLFIRTNKLLCNDIEKKSFVTVIGGFFDAGLRRLVLARAGHLPLYYYNAKTRSVEKVTPKGLGLGLEVERLFSSELEERVIPYNFNDVFVFVSDGITEAHKGDGEQFGEENLIKQLDMHSYQSAEQIRDKIIGAVTNFTAGKEQHDDQTIVVVKAT
ncbi:MAG: PP2C family protein-serine/threonine phosphatase [Ignavibacteriales bacterium]|nr:PP2C family protein-serine/threonine phosphatase [Ignavibacteriales bacterium]